MPLAQPAVCNAQCVVAQIEQYLLRRESSTQDAGVGYPPAWLTPTAGQNCCCYVRAGQLPLFSQWLLLLLRVPPTGAGMLHTKTFPKQWSLEAMQSSHRPPCHRHVVSATTLSVHCFALPCCSANQSRVWREGGGSGPWLSYGSAMQSKRLSRCVLEIKHHSRSVLQSFHGKHAAADTTHCGLVVHLPLIACSWGLPHPRTLGSGAGA